MSRNQNDPGLRADLAAAQLRVGEITDQIGSKEDALKAFQTALEMYESLLPTRPSSFESALPGRPGSLPRQDGDDPGRSWRVGPVAQLVQRSIVLLDQLNRDQPGDPRGRADLALAHHYMFLKLMQNGRLQEALRRQRAAIDLRQGLAEEFPKQLSYRIDLSLSLSNLGSRS